MDNLKAEVRKSFRTEMFAFGLYTVLGRQYKNFKPNFGEHLQEAGKQEHMHGRIFKHFYHKQYNIELKEEKVCIAVGKCVGHLLRPMPLNKKLKMISGNEAKVAVEIEKKIAEGGNKDYIKALKRILPDEIAHSKIYSEAFEAK
ncbi:ferritin family protein [Clostridium sp. C8-1-8]|uniref:ferritin family protein n=1 Tax=Clostridium sp. C8-1-8 TaxID=2698831 RepID=UPI00136B0385|nr:ferritin family protein [Clostridium sp. C8-1-8]